MGIPWEYRTPHHPPWCLSSYQQQHWKPDPQRRRHGDPGSSLEGPSPPSVSIPGWCIYILLMTVSENWGIPPNDQKLLFYFCWYVLMWNYIYQWWSTNNWDYIPDFQTNTDVWIYVSDLWRRSCLHHQVNKNMKMTLRTVFFCRAVDRSKFQKSCLILAFEPQEQAANHCSAST